MREEFYCAICMEPLAEERMGCTGCSMQGHPQCLQRWFAQVACCAVVPRPLAPPGSADASVLLLQPAHGKGAAPSGLSDFPGADLRARNGGLLRVSPAGAGQGWARVMMGVLVRARCAGES